jgi:hypothetical protein
MVECARGTVVQKEPTAFLLKLQYNSKSLPMSSLLCVCRIHSSLCILWTQTLVGINPLKKNVINIVFILDSIAWNSLGCSGDSVLQCGLRHFVSGSYAVSYSRGTRALSLGESRWGMYVTPHLCLVPRLRMSGAKPLLPPPASNAQTGKTLPFAFYHNEHTWLSSEMVQRRKYAFTWHIWRS